MKLLSVLIVVFLIVIKSYGQYSYDFLIQTPKDDIAHFVCHNEILDEQVVITYNKCSSGDSSCISFSNIYSVTNLGDTIKWLFENIRHDSVFFINRIHIDNNGDYLLTGEGWHSQDTLGKPLNVFDYNTLWDNNHDMVWESIVQRPEEFDGNSFSHGYKFLQLINGNYLVGKSIQTINPYRNRGYLTEVSNSNGVQIKNKILPYLHGYIQGLTYNLDSSRILSHVAYIYIPECDRNTEGIFILDTINFDTVQTYCYNRDDDDPTKYWCVDLPFNASLSDDGKLIVAGTGECSNNTTSQSENYLFVYKYDSGFQLIQRAFLTDKDIFIDAGWYESMEINNNNEICIVGNHDRGLGTWTSHYNWIYLAKLDENLNLISERYIGGDAAYTIYSMAATSDGGIVTTGTRYDYLVNDDERDIFVIKTDDGLWVNQNENSTFPIHSAITFPNPVTDNFYIRTKELPSKFELYDLQGKLVLSKTLSDHVSRIESNMLFSGYYIWTLRKENIIIDIGKLIKQKL